LGELAGIAIGEAVEWVWTASEGHSGGTLIGVWVNDITVLSKDKGEFFSSMKIASRKDGFKWEIVNVYGPVQMEKKSAFLSELNKKLDMEEPFIIGGDFNMIRFAWEKSTNNINQTWMNNFN
jgi:uncharacterized OB-fold protein